MKVITKEQLLKLSDTEKCRVLIDIINGKIKYDTDVTKEEEDKL